MKGTRKYSKSKRMKMKKERQKKGKCANCVLQSAKLSELSHDTASVCAAHCDHCSVCFSAETSTCTCLADDDFLHAIQAKSNLLVPLLKRVSNVLHIDYAHTISLGYHKQ